MVSLFSEKSSSVERFINFVSFSVDHDKSILRIQSIPAPSTAAKPSYFFKELQKTTTILNMWPPQCRGLPISLFHSVFGQFLKDIDSLKPDFEQYKSASELMNIAPQGYISEEERQSALEEHFWKIFGMWPQRLEIKNGSRFDGILTSDVFSEKTATVIFEYKNELGVGAADPTIQAALGYSKFWAQDHVGIFFFNEVLKVWGFSKADSNYFILT